jgi:hypothetical protein
VAKTGFTAPNGAFRSSGSGILFTRKLFNLQSIEGKNNHHRMKQRAVHGRSPIKHEKQRVRLINMSQRGYWGHIQSFDIPFVFVAINIISAEEE